MIPEADGKGERLHAYECACGEHWHLTHYDRETQAAKFDHDSGLPGLSATTNTFEDHDIRHVISNEPLWIGRDVCAAVGISKYRDALSQLDDDERVSVLVDTPGGPQHMSAVTEAGVWSLLLISRSPQAKPFKRWLTHEVLPEIRKHGRYDATTALPDRKTMAQWVIDAEERAEAAESRVRELTPSASAWNELADAAGDYAVSDAAKVLARAGISTGERRLFDFMAGIRWIYRPRGGRWRAYQDQVDNGRLVEKVGKPYVRDGVMVNGEPTVRITPKGLAELHKRLGGSGQLALVAVS